MVKLSEKGILKIRNEGDRHYLIFRSNQPAIFYDKELKKSIEGNGTEIEIPVSISQIVSLYLKLKTFEDSFLDGKDSILIDNVESRVVFYRKGKQLVVKGMDYINKQAGILYFKEGTYPFLLFISYLKLYLSNFDLLTFHIENNVVLTFERVDKILTIEDRDLRKIHYIEKDEIEIWQELVWYLDLKGEVFTHSFTPDRNILVVKEKELYINDKIFDITAFRQIGYLTMI